MSPAAADVRSVCVLGAGPIRIGQACEFDYSGVQGIQALREEGLRVVLVNSNPATIMTSPSRADATYVEPLTVHSVARVLKREECDALLPTLGGQTALNLALELDQLGVLRDLGVRLLGATVEAIRTAEDRERFREAMRRAGLPVLPSLTVTSPREALAAVEQVGFPAILRPSFTLGGTGAAMVFNREEYAGAIRRALSASPVGEVLVERAVAGWKEFELEVVRDRADTVVVVCAIENVDPMGVHTGDSITVAPAMTLTDQEYQVLRDAAATCLRVVGVETGGANVQFAVHPETGEWAVIEMNPRVSRSSALASKATGFPIARVAAKLALGWRLDELTNAITGTTPAAFEPALDYVVVKLPRFNFEKFPGAADELGTSMRSVGEAMAIGRCFEEALLKGIRSLELGREGLGAGEELRRRGSGELEETLRVPNSERLWCVAEALRRGWDEARVCSLTRWDPWFVRRVAGLVELESQLATAGLDQELLRRAKQLGFPDGLIASCCGTTIEQVATVRKGSDLDRRLRTVDTCAGEFVAKTPYRYGSCGEIDEGPQRERPCVVILGSGPNRIGQGIEFDACCVEAVDGIRAAGYEAVMVNCNPETVSTDWDAADRLYFEPLDLEDVLHVIRREQPAGVLVQFGGQTPLKLAEPLAAAGAPLWGTAPSAIRAAEDRGEFARILERLRLRRPPGEAVSSLGEALALGEKVGYPVLVRPSFVLGGRGMEVVFGEGELSSYWQREGVAAAAGYPVLLERFLERAVEVDVDAVCDGKDVAICGVLEHVEEAGVHSGDSSGVFPPVSLSLEVLAEIRRAARSLALELGVVGLFNLQLAVRDGLVYVLEANPRASRTVPFLAKATGVPWAAVAAQVCCGASLGSLGIRDGKALGVAVKMPVFPFDRFPGVDPLPGPEMRSTGEVMGLASTFGEAFAKAALGAGLTLPVKGTVFLSLADGDKERAAALGSRFRELGFELAATSGTAVVLREANLVPVPVAKVSEGRPHVVDRMINGEIHLVVNTASGSRARRDGIEIRRGALDHRIPYLATVAAAYAAAEAIAALQDGDLSVRSLQRWGRRAGSPRPHGTHL